MDGEGITEIDANLAAGFVPSVVERLRKWQKETGYRLTLDSWLTEGLTAAKVAVVIAQGVDSRSRLVIKACPPTSLTSREPRLHAEALADAPAGFRDAHLVQQPFATIEATDKWRVLFQAIAGDSLRTMRPLATVLHDNQLPVLAMSIAGSLLADWNPDFRTEETSTRVFLERELGTKLDRTGPLARFSRESDLEGARWVRFSESPGAVLPNAIMWCASQDPWPSGNLSLQAHLGRVHGDLHPGNVLIQINPAPDAREFRLIDMSDYTSNGSLTRDLVHLALSVINEHWQDNFTWRDALLIVALGHTASVPLELSGVQATVGAITRKSRDWASSAAPGMRDDWDDQLALSMATEALRFVGMTSLPMPKRLWFFRLACRALGGYLESHGETRHRLIDPARVPMLGKSVSGAVRGAIDKLWAECDSFSGQRSTVCIIAPGMEADETRVLGTYPWTAVISFDKNLAQADPADSEGESRLVTKGQSARYARGSTTWLALGGLSDLPDTISYTDTRTWRRAYRETIETSLESLAKFTPHPVTVVAFGEPDDRVRIVAEEVDDRFGERSQIILVNEGAGRLEDFVDQHFPIDAQDVIAGLPPYARDPELDVALPALDGPLRLEPTEDSWIRELADIVDLSAGTSAEGLEDVGYGFLRGRRISWFELGLNLDVIPDIAQSLFDQISEELKGRDTRRVSLFHYPGAGGTTLARRVAWEMHRDVPTVYCASVSDEHGLAQRVGRLSQVTGLPVLVVLEQATELVADRFFNRLRGDSIPAVVLIVSRRVRVPQKTGSRSFYLGPAATPGQVAELARRYAEYSPGRRTDLAAVRPGTTSAVPFYFGLIAFEADYRGLEEYVDHSLSGSNDDEQEILRFIALIHQYAGVSIAGDLFADILGVRSNQLVQLSTLLSDAAKGLLIEDEPGYWRTVHWLVAQEAVRQLLLPVGSRDAEAWKLSLSMYALRIIDESLRVFGQEPPDDIHDVLERLFLVRENREELDDPQSHPFSELVESIPSASGRLQVLQHLAESFPEEAHYWAHYGRLLSYEMGDTRGALEAINKALELDSSDSVLYHMRGMVYSRQVRRINPGKSWDEEELLKYTELALEDFTQAAHLKDDSEYPHVASIQTAVAAIDHAYRRSGCSSHAEFFTLEKSAPYRSLLEQAEDALAAISEIRGADRMSQRAEEASLKLKELYDDYSALLQGWRNLLERGNVFKAPIRRQLARVYLRRAGNWSSMRAADRNRVLALLDENLHDDPTDGRSLRDWLRVARFDGGLLDRASELTSYWSSQSDDRDAVYYDYVMSVLQVISGRESLLREAQRKIDRCRARTAAFGNRKFSHEWLGHESGLGMLVNSADLPDTWDRSDQASVPNELMRVPARVNRIDAPQTGTLQLQSGLEAFFVPARVGVMRNRHENVRVEAVIGFSYDGLRAWSVRLAPKR
jgi:tetratricopeptide (TPR) repeat protein